VPDVRVDVRRRNVKKTRKRSLSRKLNTTRLRWRIPYLQRDNAACGSQPAGKLLPLDALLCARLKLRQFLLDICKTELLVCFCGRGIREIHRQMQALVFP
jgi:hypothetical protein